MTKKNIWKKLGVILQNENCWASVVEWIHTYTINLTPMDNSNSGLYD